MSFNSDVLAAVEVLAARSRLGQPGSPSASPPLRLPRPRRDLARLRLLLCWCPPHLLDSRCLEAFWSAGAPTLPTDWFFLVLTVWTWALRHAVIHLLNVLCPRAVAKRSNKAILTFVDLWCSAVMTSLTVHESWWPHQVGPSGEASEYMMIWFADSSSLKSGQCLDLFRAFRKDFLKISFCWVVDTTRNVSGKAKIIV